MRKTRQLLWVSIIFLAVITGLVGCKSATTQSSEDTAIRAYADPATETTMQGLSEDNLTKYTQYGAPEFKAALTQEILDKTSASLKTQTGTYVSKEFLSTGKQDDYTIVHYKAKFTKTTVWIKMVFDKNHLVAGQWFE